MSEIGLKTRGECSSDVSLHVAALMRVSSTPPVTDSKLGIVESPVRFPWHEVKKVEHYYLSVDALTQPMQIIEQAAPYEKPAL